jgi:hypothetical protein
MPPKRPYDWNQRPLGAPLPRGTLRRPRPEPRPSPPADRTVWIILACVPVALAISVVAVLALRGTGEEPKSARSPDEPWEAPEIAAWVEPEPAAPTPAVEARSTPSPAAARPAGGPATPEVLSPAAPAAEAPPKKATKARKPAKAKPAAPKDAGENRLVTLVLSGALEDRELDPDDPQTWARLSYFLREEVRSPHFLVYPDGSIPLSMPQQAAGKAPPAPRVAVPDPDPDAEPTYRLVIEASAGEGAGVTFYRQRLGRTFRSQVSCRIEKKVGDEFKVLGQAAADESTSLAKDSVADPGASTRQAYDAAIEKLLRQLAGQLPFR